MGEKMRKQAWLGLGMSAAVLIALIAVLVAASTAWGLPLSARNASSTASQASSSVASSPSSGQRVRSPRPAQSDQASATQTTLPTATSPSHPRPGAQTPRTTTGTAPSPSTSSTPTKTAAQHKPIFYPSQAAWKQAQQAQKAHTKASASPQTASAYDLAYNYGPVQHTPTTYLIFWGPSWASGGSDNGTAQLVESYFNDLGGTSFQNILTQYYDGTGPISNVENFSSANVYFDTSAPPTDQSCGTGYPSIEEPDIETEISNAIAARNWPTKYGNDLFLVYTPNGDYINEGGSPSNVDCNTPAPNSGGGYGAWCAYHNFGLWYLQNYQNYMLAYAAVPYPGSGCQVSYSPNSNLAGDSLINLSSYEAFNVVSDPDYNGWSGSTYYGQEIADPCAWTFPPTNNGETTLNNGGVFEVQEEYSNASSSCVNSYTSPAQTPPLVSSVNPTSAPVGASVTIVGAYLSGATSVTFNGTSASFKVNAFGEINATVPSGATSGSIVVTTAQGTSAPYAFTVTQPLATAVITNGGFEGIDSLTGSLSGWTTSGTTSVSTVASAGRYSAMLGATTATNGDSSISQTFGVTSTGTQLSFAYEVNCPGSVSTEWATATIFDKSTGQTTAVLPATCSTGQGWQYQYVDLSGMINHTVTLTLTNHDDNVASDPTYTYFDDVSIYYCGPNCYTVWNPSFEPDSTLDNQPGTLEGWTTTGTVSVEATSVHAGHWAAEVGASTPTNGDSVLSQTLYAPYITPSALSFWYKMSCSGTVSSDWVTATLYDQYTNNTVTILPPTCTNTGAWTEVTASLDGMEGDPVTLTFTNHDASGTGATGTYAYFDDVNVS